MSALFVTAFLIGVSKTGIQGIVMLSVPFMALAFGPKESTGVILPMLCFADLIGVSYYRRSANWSYIIKLVPAAVVGFFVAVAVDKFVPPEQFKLLMAFCIFLGLGVMAISNRYGHKMEKIFRSRIYAQTFGLLGGFTTMIGNAAGPVMSVYLLSIKLPKLEFVGTSAWFFLLVNYLKAPIQIFAWDNISLQTLVIDAFAIPLILLGAWVGIAFVKRVPESTYRRFIFWITAASALVLVF